MEIRGCILILDLTEVMFGSIWCEMKKYQTKFHVVLKRKMRDLSHFRCMFLIIRQIRCDGCFLICHACFVTY